MCHVVSLRSVAAGLAVAVLPFGHHPAAHRLTNASANLGELTIFPGWRYREYA